MGFDESWTRLIMRCVTSVSHAVVINGVPSDYFRPRRGLRQGDPISPYLFILCAEVFSHLIQMEVNRNSIQGVRICKGAPSVSHLLFADDSIIFCRANSKDVQTIKSVVECYSQALGQSINSSKSEVAMSENVNDLKKRELADELNVKLVEKWETIWECLRGWGDPKPMLLPL